MLEEIIEEVVLQESPDNQLCPLVGKDGTLRAGLIYAAMMNLQEHTPCPFYKFVWIKQSVISGSKKTICNLVITNMIW